MNAYLRKHQLYPVQISTRPGERLELAVVIPCHNEPNLLPTLECLWSCQRPDCDTEVLVVINASEADDPAVQGRNRETLAMAREWSAQHSDPRLRFYFLDFPALPRRHAGVGLARKLGMDEAVARFHAAGNTNGVIVNLDADCLCRLNYLTSIKQHFAAHVETPGCAIYFEHPIHEVLDPRLRLGAIRYELYLRYYIHGLRYAAFPYAYHTVGSCMAVRSHIYEKMGGMNRRQAGEDFYFLHKIIPLGNFTELRDTAVFPAVRLSHRVPYGTGKAIADWVDRDDGEYLVYGPAVFADLKTLFESIDTVHESTLHAPLPDGLTPTLVAFLRSQRVSDRLSEIRANTASARTFRRRFFHWFNALRVLKYAHHATEHAHPKVPVEQAALTVLRWRGLLPPNASLILTDAEALLQHYRQLDRACNRMAGPLSQ